MQLFCSKIIKQIKGLLLKVRKGFDCCLSSTCNRIISFAMFILIEKKIGLGCETRRDYLDTGVTNLKRYKSK